LKVRIPNHFCRMAALAAMFVTQAVVAAESAAPRFAAPGAASSLPSGGASGIGQVTFALLLVLAAVFGVAWMLKRLRAVTGAGANGIEVLAQTSLGSKERAVIVRVGNERLLLGVAAGQVTLLQTLPPDASAPNPPDDRITFQKPNFAALLKKSLGR
jgi:flagellar protein FliO/FliZ